LSEDQATEAAAAEPLTPAAPATFSVVEVLAIRMELPSQFPIVTLQESEAPFRTLEIPIGLPEGVALSQALGKVTAPRPGTHALFVSVLERFHLDVVAVRITGRQGGVYFAELDLIGKTSHEVLPCRPTDALTIALRSAIAAPILCDERLFADGGDVTPV